MAWFIIVLLTINNGVASKEVLSNKKCKSELSCKEFVVKNYDRLNERVNKDHDQHESTPNLYSCVVGLP